MFQKQSGGLGGLLDLFKQKGLASIASNWPGGGKGLPLGINPRQLENVIGGARSHARAAPAYTPTPAAAAAKGSPWWWILIPLILLLGWCATRKSADAPPPIAP